MLPLEKILCPLCGERTFTGLFLQRDLALGVPGQLAIVRCDSCGLLYQNPRVRVDQLSLLYPTGYAAHKREPHLTRTLRNLGPSVQWVLTRYLGYPNLEISGAITVKIFGILNRRRILKAFPPWVGDGRLLDIGCASGKYLRQMGAVGWRLAGIEVDADAAVKALTVTPNIFVGDPANAPFLPGSFDLITAFHVIEHLPDPLGALRNMLTWLAPAGLIIIEVPNASGVGAKLFGRYWAGFDVPRHLVHFTPETMNAMVEKAGGRIEQMHHRTKPRYIIRSLKYYLADRSGTLPLFGRAIMHRKLSSGLMKIALEIIMPLAKKLRRGDAVRYFIRAA